MKPIGAHVLEKVVALAEILYDLMVAHPGKSTLPSEHYTRSNGLGGNAGGVNVMRGYAYLGSPRQMVEIAKYQSEAPHDLIDAAYALLFN